MEKCLNKIVTFLYLIFVQIIKMEIIHWPNKHPSQHLKYEISQHTTVDLTRILLSGYSDIKIIRTALIIDDMEIEGTHLEVGTLPLQGPCRILQFPLDMLPVPRLLRLLKITLLVELEKTCYDVIAAHVRYSSEMNPYPRVSINFVSAIPYNVCNCHEHHVIDGTNPDGTLSYATTSLI
jgi:hypothetical protein